MTVVTVSTLFLVAFSTHLTAQAVQNCPGNAFSLPIEDVQVLSNISNSYMKGIPVSIGTPAQKIVTFPWAELNNTYIYDIGYCDPTVVFSDLICQVKRGNLFQDSSSSSFTQQHDLVSAGGATQETSDPNAENGIPNLISTSLAGTENLQLANAKEMIQFPVGIPRQSWDHGYSFEHPLGLGSNSTYLNTLVKAGTIGARVWSMWFGRVWTNNNPVTGSLVLGGYDSRKVLGQNYTQKLDYSGGCFTGLKLEISDIVLNLRSGVDQSIADPNTIVPVCIVPTRQLLMALPSRYLARFTNYTNTVSIGPSFGLDWSSMLFNATSVYDGDITIKFENGLSTRIVNDQFVVPFVDIGRDGNRFFNMSEREVLIGVVDQQVATLGRYFLTSAVIMVDHDAGTFTLWNANPTPSENLVPIVNAATTCTSNNSTGTTAGNSTSGTSKPKPRGLSTPVLIGTIVGTIVLLCIIAGLIWSCIRLRRQKRKTNNVVHYENEPNQTHEYYDKAELHSSSTNYIHDHRQELHQSYVQPRDLDKKSSSTRSPVSTVYELSENRTTDKSLYEMPDRATLPFTPLLSDRNRG